MSKYSTGAISEVDPGMARPPATIWVASWVIDWAGHGFPPSFGVVGVADSQGAAEQLLADEMVSNFGATLRPREKGQSYQDWLYAISQTSPQHETVSLLHCDLEFFVTEFDMPLAR